MGDKEVNYKETKQCFTFRSYRECNVSPSGHTENARFHLQVIQRMQCFTFRSYRECNVSPSGYTENVMVNHITSPHNFFIQLNSDQSKLATLSYSMQRWCNSQQGRATSLTEVDQGKCTDVSKEYRELLLVQKRTLLLIYRDFFRQI